MGKVLAVVLVLMAVVGGGAYFVTNQNNSTKVKPAVPTSVVSTSKITPSPSSAPLLTTDASIDTDITALDKDLAGLEQSDTILTQEVNGL